MKCRGTLTASNLAFEKVTEFSFFLGREEKKKSFFFSSLTGRVNRFTINKRLHDLLRVIRDEKSEITNSLLSFQSDFRHSENPDLANRV